MPCVCYQNMRDSIDAFFNNVREWISARFDVYEKIQAMIVIHIYIQIGCSLIGSLGALYNGVTWINLAISLFALIAIASDIESLILTYAVLLSCSIVIDFSWFIFFFHTIWNMSSEGNGMLFLVSIRLTLATEMVGLVVRFFTCLLLIQLYRLGLVSSVDSGGPYGKMSSLLQSEDAIASFPYLRGQLDAAVRNESTSGTQDSAIQPA